MISHCSVIACSLIFNFSLLKDISDEMFVTKYLVRAIFKINHPCHYWKFWSRHFTRAISKISEMHWGDLSKFVLPNIWLLVQFFKKIIRFALFYRFMLIATTIQLCRTFPQEICWKFFSCQWHWLTGSLNSTNFLLTIVIYY